MPKNFLGGRTVGHLKVPLLFIEDCGIFWCSRHAALIDTHCLRSAFFWLWSIKKHRDGARHFFIEHPSSILFGIHLNRFLKMVSEIVGL